jgi:hypothetical protein
LDFQGSWWGGVGLRRTVAVAAALILVVEAVGMVLLNVFLSMVVDEQQMSMAGLDPRAMSLSAVIAGVLFGLYLLLCAGVLVRTAIRDRAPHGLLRILLISAAVVHGLLGGASLSMVGPGAFVFMVVVLGLLVWALICYAAEEGPPRGADADSPRTGGSSDSGSGGGSGGGSTAGTPGGGAHPKPSAP